MGKFAGTVLVVFGVLLTMLAAGIFFGMMADNTLMIIAAPMLVFDFLVLAAGIFLIYQGYKRISAANNNNKEAPTTTLYHYDNETNTFDKRSPI